MKKNNNKFELTVSEVIRLYSIGAFPMAEDDGSLNWYRPKVRAIIPLGNYNIPRSLRKIIKQGDFEVKFDTSQLTVVSLCKKIRHKTWISDELIEYYKSLNELGYLHSVETYLSGQLVGGLYGIAINGAFFGESMFSLVNNASKFALYHLIIQLNKKGFSLLDVQIMNDHLRQFGAIEIEIEEFFDLLNYAYSESVKFI